MPNVPVLLICVPALATRLDGRSLFQRLLLRV